MGPIKLAQMTGAPIGAFHLEPEHAWVMRSWDRFLVPKPFTRICVSWAQWTRVPADLPAERIRNQARRTECGDRARAAARACNTSGKRIKSEGMSGLRVADFDFDLPEELIAQQPPAERGHEPHVGDGSRDGRIAGCGFAEFPSLLNQVICWCSTTAA